MNSWRRSSLVAAFALTIWILWRSATFSPSPHEPSGVSPNDHKTFASHVVKRNTIVFVPVNSGMLHLAKNLACSLSKTAFNVSDLVFWALDESAERTLSREGYATYRDPSLFSVSGNENRKGITTAYRRMMKERPKFYINILASGYNILMLDADTVFWQSPVNIIPDINDSVDAVYSTDAREFFQTKNAFHDERRRGSIMPPICNGVFWMRSSKATISLWSDMLDVFNAGPPFGWIKRIDFQDDQRGMDVLLNDGRARLVGPFPDGINADIVGRKHPRTPELSVRLLDQTMVVNGHLIQNRGVTYQKHLARLRDNSQDRIGAHFNWDTKFVGKEDGARQHGMYFLDEHGNCAVD